MANEKKTSLAYLFWLLGGWFGLHHLYLRRDTHAFLIWSTGAGYFGLGLIRDLWRIPEYVRDANNDEKFIQALTDEMRKKKKPPFNFFRSCGAVVAGNLWGWLFQLAIPKEQVIGIDFQFLEILVPVAIALGVHTVGNVGRIQGTLFWPLMGAYSYFLFKFVDVDSMSLASLISATLFEWKSAKWRRTPRPKHGLFKRARLLVVFSVLYLSLWSSYLYFNAEVTDSSGESIKFRDGVANFLTSPLWVDFKNTFHLLLSSLWNNGWSETWNQLKDDLDPFGEQQALKILGLEHKATQEEITAKWRKLSREWHPDRFMDEVKKKEAQEKFMEYNAAYETLSQIKARRTRKNKSFQDY